MSYLETFTAYDEKSREHRVVVHATPHTTISAGTRLVKSYSLEATKEVLEILHESPLVLRARDSGLLLADIRDV